MHFLILLQKAGILEAELAIVDSVIVHAFGGGDASGPSPVDHRTLCAKHTLVVDENGVTLVIHTAPANASHHGQILPAVAEFPRVPGKRGRPSSHTDVLFTDRGYDSEATRDAMRSQSIKPVISHRGVDHGNSLGRIRWVVEHTISWFKGFRRIRVRHDRLIPTQHDSNEIAAAIICFRTGLRRGISIGCVLPGTTSVSGGCHLGTPGSRGERLARVEHWPSGNNRTKRHTPTYMRF
jgi:transposase